MLQIFQLLKWQNDYSVASSLNQHIPYKEHNRKTFHNYIDIDNGNKYHDSY